MPLLNDLVVGADNPAGRWLLIFDDDVTFARSGQTRFLEVTQLAGFDIAQPSIEPGQPHSHELTVTRFLSIARRSRFVEVGPVVAFSPKAQELTLPFPRGAQMGWGVDVLWAGIADRAGLLLGIVDAEPILHHGGVAMHYDSHAERPHVSAALAAAGYETEEPLLQWLPPRWSSWQASPPWLR